jgi:phage shock protein A
MPNAADERKHRIAELEALAARMEQQIELAEETIRDSRRNIAALREQIKSLLASDDNPTADEFA